MDLFTTSLLFFVLGDITQSLVKDVVKDYLKDKLKSLSVKPDEQKKIELAYQDAMEKSFVICLEMLLANIKSAGYRDEELKLYKSSIEAFMKDKIIAEEMLKAIQEPDRVDLPSPYLLQDRWAAVGGKALPIGLQWEVVANAFRRNAKNEIFLSDELRKITTAKNIQDVKGSLDRLSGVKVPVSQRRYFDRMKQKFSCIDLLNLLPSSVGEPETIQVQDLFVAQKVRVNPPPVEIPKDLAEQLFIDGLYDPDEDNLTIQEKVLLESYGEEYLDQTPKPVLDVIAFSPSRLIVLTGEAGSGKSTLLQYLLTCVINPPKDHQTGDPLSWASVFSNTFPLLIELRYFDALRSNNKCNSFLEYVKYIGNTEQWFIDDIITDQYLDGPSLVMFDGLDEVLDSKEREHIMQQIVGFAQRYPKARIIVTSRPAGFKGRVFRDAGFDHYGIQDLDDEQKKIFIDTWFQLTFNRNPELAEQRINRVLKALENKHIRLLAGNPMLLTIMVLLAREQELPRERAMFYKKAVELLCHFWDVNRHLELPEGYLSVGDKEILLGRIAMRMVNDQSKHKGNFIQEEELEEEVINFLIDEYWQPDKAEARKAARRLIEQLRERNYITCLRGFSLYGFVHRTFLEFLAATVYVRWFDKQPQKMTIEGLINLYEKHSHEEHWREILRLICGQIDEEFVGYIIDTLIMKTDLSHWDGISALPELNLAIYCLSEVRKPAKLRQSGLNLLQLLINCFSMAKDKGFLENFEEPARYLVAATREVGTNWPGKSEISKNDLETPIPTGRHYKHWPELIANIFNDRSLIERMSISNSEYLRTGALKALARYWADDRTRDLLEDRAIQDEYGSARVSALDGLARYWANGRTRDLLEDRAIQDEDKYARSLALKALAKTWADNRTRRLLEDRAIQDENGFTRAGAFDALAETWTDNRTRRLLEDRAIQNEDKSDRANALDALACHWADDRARDLLEDRATKDQIASVRARALKALARYWVDDRARDLLEDRAIQDEGGSARGRALKALAETWADNRTRDLLEDRAIQDEGGSARGRALDALAETWADNRTYYLLEDRAIQDEDKYARSRALKALAETWADNRTRDLLEDRAIQDESGSARGRALKALAKTWADNRTRRLLEDRAIQDEDGFTRARALDALAHYWADDRVRDLLEDRAIQDEDGSARAGALDALARYWADDRTRRL